MVPKVSSMWGVEYFSQGRGEHVPTSIILIWIQPQDFQENATCYIIRCPNNKMLMFTELL